MADYIQKPTMITAAGQPPKSIEEYFGRVNSQTTAVSVARMKSPAGWSEPGQTPEFDEYTVVLRGALGLRRVVAFVRFASADSQQRAGQAHGGEQDFFHSI